MRRPSLLATALLAALAGCADDGVSDSSAATSASITATATTTATATASSGDSASTADTTASSDSATDTSTGTSTSSTMGQTTGESATGESATDTSTTDTSTGTTGVTSDPVNAAAPSWLRALDGLIVPPRIAPLPSGDALAVISGGLYDNKIVIADGDPDEVVLASSYVVPALARFDGESGALTEARLLAKLIPGSQYGIGVSTHDLVVADNGDLLVDGTWSGSAEFFPGTGDAAAMIAEDKLNGDTLDRAYEPFFYRMTPTGAITWLVRGRTPAGLKTTWRNDAQGIAALPGDEVMIAGEYELPGFVVADGKPGAKTMSGSQSSYFARLGADGSPSWVYRNSAQFFPGLLRSGADGALYSLLPPEATIFADTDTPTMTASEPGLSTVVLGRIALAGGLEWTANIAQAGTYYGRFEVTAHGDLIILGRVKGELLVRDASNAQMLAQTDAYEGWLAGLSPAGEGLWLHTLGPLVSFVGPILAGDDGVWIVARVAAPYELVVAGELTPLPSLGYPPESTATVLLRVNGLGEVVAAEVVGADLPIASLTWSGPDQLSFLVAGSYWCDSQSYVVDGGGEALEALASGCVNQGPNDQRGFVAAIPRTP